jgi:integrase
MGKLTVLKVNSIRDAGMYPDGDGLYLQVTGPQSKSWIYRFTIAGKARWLGLGSLNTVSLAEARQKRDDERRKIRGGIDPVAEKRALRQPEEATAITFKEAAETYVKAQSWRNAKHAAQWPSTLAAYVHPVIGDKGVASIERSDIIAILEPIWTTKAETARRVRGRIETVIDWAIARDAKLRIDNPARRGPLEKGLPKQNRKVKHHEALPYADAGKFLTELRTREGTAAAALEFLILTAARTGEVIGACWSEIDFAARMWTVSAARMKAGREHRVPLSKAALAVLDRMKGQGGDFIFHGGKAGRGLSNMALLKVLERAGYPDLTAHGFRSTFRDWAAERTYFPREVAEMALAHTVGDAVEAAYRRGDLFAKRRQLMDAWADYCARPGTVGDEQQNNVTLLRRGA